MRIIIGFDGASENSCLRTRYTTCMYFNPAKDPFFFFYWFLRFLFRPRLRCTLLHEDTMNKYNVRRIETTF